MSHLEREIKDEEKGEHEYKKLAHRYPKDSKKFSRMAKDEHRHHESLERMERAEKSEKHEKHHAKHRALKKRTKEMAPVDAPGRHAPVKR